jgi:hypothetical protein
MEGGIEDELRYILVQNDPGTHLVPCSMGKRDISWREGKNQLGRGVGHPPPIGQRSKNSGSMSLLLLCVNIGALRGDIYLYFEQTVLN